MARSARFTRPFLPYKTHPQFHPLRHPLLAMSAKQSTPSNLVAFPSVSASLCQLPHATSMQNIAIHPSMYANRAAESEAKLQKALSSKANSGKVNPIHLTGPPLDASNSSSPPLMMNSKKPKPKFQT